MQSRSVNNPEVIKEVLDTGGRIAIVGLSPKAERDSNKVAKYLLNHGFDIVPVNPMADEILGKKSYKSVAEIEGEVDVIDIFRRPDDVPPIVDQAVEKGAKYVWLQLGVVNKTAAVTAQKAGLGVVMNRCIKIEHEKK
ncbi:MAG: CoA-binding protein [Candidatus Electryonea clarkiae]|nr:CoA-binding protein [Candidatus Electryonea clarkiae]MDP8286951.1 CoA-binding protein [Candidatus Electryonea clarkiae]